MTVEEIDQVVAEFLEGEIVDLASDWLGNTVRSSKKKKLNSLLICFLGRSKTF
jgi:protein JSN1